MPDYSELVDHRAAHPAAAEAPTPQRLMALLRESQRGAAVLTELLDSPAWDTFRSVLGFALETAEAERAILRDRVDTGELVGDERARADLRAQYLRGRIEALREAMDLPKRLIDRHEALDKLAGEGGGAHGPVGSGRSPEATDGAGYPTAAPVVKSAAGAASPRRILETR